MRLLGLGSSIVFLIVVACCAITAGEIRYSQFAPIVHRDVATINDPDDVYGWNATGGPGAPVEYALGVRPPWWKHWFCGDPLDLDRETWIGYDLVVERASTHSTSSLIEAAVFRTPPGSFSDRLRFPPVGSDVVSAGQHVVLQPADRFAPDPSRPIWTLDVNLESGLTDIRPASFVSRGNATPVSEDVGPRHGAPEVAVLVFLALGIAVLVPLRRRWMNSRSDGVTGNGAR